MKNEKQRLTEEDFLNAIKIIDEYQKQLKQHYLEVDTKNRSLKKYSELDDLDKYKIPTRLCNTIKKDFMDVRLCDITKEEFFKARWAGKGSWNDLCDFINEPNNK
jgi:hypothetical protein